MKKTLFCYEKYEKMLKWNNVIKKFTIYHHHNPLLLGVLLFLENAFLGPTRDTTAACRNAQKIFKAGKLLFFFRVAFESLQNVSRGFKHVC